MFSNALNRFSKITAATLLAATALTSPALAFDDGGPEGSDIEGRERRAKVQRAITLLKNAVGSDTATLDSEFGSGANQSEHHETDGEATTTNQAIDQLRNMLDTNRLREDTMNGRGSTCTDPDGPSRDRVWVNSATLDQMCDKPNDEGDDVTSDPCQAAAYFFLGATLYNEVIHVYQETSSNADQCDAEHDSDCASIKYLQKIYDCLTKPDPNDPTKRVPHDSPADTFGDPDYVSMVYTTLNDSNINTAEEMAALVAKIKARLDSYKHRKENLFAAAIDLGIDWGPIYRNGWDGVRVTRDAVTPTGTVIDPSNDDQTLQFFPAVQNGNSVQSRVIENEQHQPTLIQANVGPFSQVQVQFFIDFDGDGIPDLPQVITPQPIPIQVDFAFDESNFGIYDRFPQGLHPNGGGDGLLFHDQLTGTLVAMPLDPFGLPAGPAQMLIQDPIIDAFGFRYLSATMTMPNGDVRIVFSTEGETGQYGSAPAIWFDFPAGSPFPIPTTFPGLTIADAAAPFYPVGIAQLEQGLDMVQLGGNPGSFVELSSIGQGSLQPLGAGGADQTGSTGPVVLSQPLAGPDLFEVFADGISYTAFLPRQGMNTDCAFIDSNADFITDRWDISCGPARLHYSEGAALPPLMDFAYELMFSNPYAQSFEEWDSLVRRIEIADPQPRPVDPVPIEMVQLSLVSSQPIVVETGNDWHLGLGDPLLPDSVTFIRENASTQFQMVLVEDVNTPAQTFTFPHVLETSDESPFTHFEVGDGDSDGDFDIFLYIPGTSTTFNGHIGFDLFGVYVNNGSGGFTLFPDLPQPCEGDVNGDGIVDVNDISYVLFRLGQPGPDGDANADGSVDVNDISYVLFRLGNVCLPGSRQSADFDANGQIDVNDIACELFAKSRGG